MLKKIEAKVKSYSSDKVKFVKTNYEERILNKRNFDEKKLIQDLLAFKDVKYVEKQVRIYQNKPEKRYKIYMVYSKNIGRVYCVRFNDILKIITVHKLGRKTLNKWRKKLEEERK